MPLALAACDMVGCRNQPRAGASQTNAGTCGSSRALRFPPAASIRDRALNHGFMQGDTETVARPGDRDRFDPSDLKLKDRYVLTED
jgi:hypothetical protein